MKNLSMVIWLLSWFPAVFIADYFAIKTRLMTNETIEKSAKNITSSYALFVVGVWVGIAWLLYQP